MKIDKLKILQELRDRVQKDLDQAKSALSTARKHASEEELKSDGKYDTRSIEAGYLAGALQVRATELEQELALLGEISFEFDHDQLSIGSLAEIELNQNKRHYFISSTSGGSLISIDDCPILVISAFSPIAAAAIGLSVGETFEVEINAQVREYKIISIS